MTYSEIINKVSDLISVPPDIIDKVYKAYWLYIKESIQKLPLKENLTESDFIKLRPNFNIPSIGKLCCTYDRYLGVKSRFKNISNIRKKNEEAN